MATGGPTEDQHSDRKDPFKTALVDVAKELKKEEVKTLAFECPMIARSDRDKIDDGVKLFDTMTSNRFVTRNNVDGLIELLSRRHLNQAVSILKDYKEEFITLAVDFDKCPVHEEYVLNKYCESCNKAVCAECVCEVHNKCHFFAIRDIPGLIIKDKDVFFKLVKSAEEGVVTTQRKCSEQQKWTAKCQEQARKQIVESALRLTMLIEEKKKDLLVMLESKKDQENEENSRAMKFSDEVKNLKFELESVTGSQLPDWRRVKYIQVRAYQVSREIKNFKEHKLDILCKMISNDGTFCEIQQATLVGGVMINFNQMVHVHDERLANGSILLICFDPSDPSKEYWRHRVKTGENNFPVVMSSIAIFYGMNSRILLAIGNMVFIVHPNWSFNKYTSVRLVDTLLIVDVPDGSWITTISGHYPTSDARSEFVISVHNSKVIKEYKVDGDALRTIDVTDIVCANSIQSISYCYDTFAIIERGCDEVILVSTASKVKRCGSLRSLTSGRLPLAVIWTGIDWLLLSIGQEVEKKSWEIVKYEKTGKPVKECFQGYCCSCCDPISISRILNDGYVSHRNSIVRTFKY